MNSIRRFLIVVLLGTIMLVNIAAVVYGYRNSMIEAEKLFDEQLMSIASILAETPPGTYRTVANNDEIAYQIWRGKLLVASSDNAPADPIAERKPGFSDVSIDGERWRAFAGFVNNSKRWVIVAESFNLRLTLANSIVLESVLPILLSLPILGGLIWFIVGRGLQPLANLAGEMRNKRSDDLSALTDLGQPRELSVLVNSVNDLLRRLDAAFERERQFAADAAHELRTPISVLKIQLHNLLADSADENKSLKSLEAAVQRMSHSVEQVLTLYRMSPEQFVANFEKVDLTVLARNVIAELYPQLEAREQQIELEGASALVNGDTSMLETMLRNLIENASRYCGTGGAIRVGVQKHADGVILSVEDNGPGIPVEHRKRVFERFYRGQRDSGPAGTGIGLSIVKNVADTHKARISLGDSSFDSGLAVSVAFNNSE